jgi:tight adherence protein C
MGKEAMNEYYWLGLVFVAVAGLTYVALRRFFRSRHALEERWKQWEEDPEPREPQMVLGSITNALASQLPMSQRARVEIRHSLRTAGYYRPTALVEFTALRAILVLTALVLTAVLALLAPMGQMRPVLLGGAIVAMLCYTLPRLFLILAGRRRRRQIQRGLGYAIDLLSMSLSAGQNTLSALRQVSQELTFTFPALSEELDVVHRQAQLSSLSHALHQLADRVGVPEVRNLALLLIQSERLGADASTALFEFSTYHRTNMRQNAEAQANRTTFWMMFPSVCCLWVAGCIILVGPIYYQFWQQWAETAQRASETQKELNVRANNGQRDAGVAAQPAQPAPINP